MEGKKVFISYSHKDLVWKDRLLEHLAPLKKQGLLDVWSDERIRLGDNCRQEIEEAIASAKMAILLISVHFLNSSFISEKEVPMMLKRQKENGLRFLPIILDHCLWKDMEELEWLSELQARPKGKCLSSFKGHRQRVLMEIAKEIKELIEAEAAKPKQERSYLIATIEKAHQNWKVRIEKTIENLINVAGDLGKEDTASSLAKIKNKLIAHNFKVIIIGLSKTGKSTLVNTLLGPPMVQLPELSKNQGPMPTDDLPTTATFTTIRYSDMPYVKAWDSNGNYKDWALSEYLWKSTIRDCEEETRSFFQNIRAFEMGYPSELGRLGIIFIDSPETGNVELIRRVIQEEKCAATIMVYRSDNFPREGEKEFAWPSLRDTPTFTVINARHKQDNEQRVKSFIWDKLVTDQKGGGKYKGQDFTKEGIYFVDILKAEQGKLNNNANLMVQSGILELEKALGDFLIKEQYRPYLCEVIHQANRYAVALEEELDNLLKQSEKKLKEISLMNKEEQNLFLSMRHIQYAALDRIKIQRGILSDILMSIENDRELEPGPGMDYQRQRVINGKNLYPVLLP